MDEMDTLRLVMKPGPGWPSDWITIIGDGGEENFRSDVSSVFQDYGFKDWATEYFIQNRQDTF